MVLVFFQSHVYLQTKFLKTSDKLKNNFSYFSTRPNFSDYLLKTENFKRKEDNFKGICLNTIAFVNSKENCEILNGRWEENRSYLLRSLNNFN